LHFSAFAVEGPSTPPAKRGATAVKSLVMSASAIGGAGAYASSERAACDFSKDETIPRCVNSIFGLLQMELSVQGLENAQKVAARIYEDGHENLKIDLKKENFCIHPLKDVCSQDAIDKEVVALYEPLRQGSSASYHKAAELLQAQINGRLAEFEAQGYTVDKIKRKVTPPLGEAQSFSGGKEVAARLFKMSHKKFSKIAMTDLKMESKALQGVRLADASGLLNVARRFLGLRPSSPQPSKRSQASVYGLKTKDLSFLAGLSDAQKERARVAPQGERVFGTMSSRYKKLQKSGHFIQP